MFISNPITIGSTALKKNSQEIQKIATEITLTTAVSSAQSEPTEPLVALKEEDIHAQAAARVIKSGAALVGSLLNIKV